MKYKLYTKLKKQGVVNSKVKLKDLKNLVAGVYGKQHGGNHYSNFKIQPSKFINANNLPFSEVASLICDQVYENAPIIRNELVNRKVISPTGIAAVKKAVETILKGTNELRGGLDGQGAEVSIFRSLLGLSHIHLQKVQHLTQ